MIHVVMVAVFVMLFDICGGDACGISSFNNFHRR